MDGPRIYADFQNADPAGRLRLNCAGTSRDLAEKEIRLAEGLAVVLHDDDELEADGVARFSPEENLWVAVIDWDAIRRPGA